VKKIVTISLAIILTLGILFGVKVNTKSIESAEIDIGRGTFGGATATYRVVANSIQAMRFENNFGTGQLTTLALYTPEEVDSYVEDPYVRMGIYDDNHGKPGTLMLDAGEVYLSGGNYDVFTEITGLTLPVTEGRYYWLAFNLKFSADMVYITRQDSGSHVWVSHPYGALPETFPVTNLKNKSQFIMQAVVVED
jgi:hypothetical protein